MCLGAALSFFLGEIYDGLESPSDGAVELVQGWQRSEEDFPAYRVPKIMGGALREESATLFADLENSLPPQASQKQQSVPIIWQSLPPIKDSS